VSANALTLASDAAPAETSISALAAGDDSALCAVYRAHHAHVRAFARRLVGSEDEAEDLVHEVFSRLPGAARRFRGGSSLRTLLVGMAINLARHYVRAAARRRAAGVRLAREPRTAAQQPADPVERRQLAEALVRALDTLPLDQRVAFVLCEVEERTSAEAAALARTNDGTMRARLMSARQKLRAQLRAWGYGT
jgi:RNA polymerase sigma-70 factor (ECF subfamily)